MARQMVRKVVDDLVRRRERNTRATLRGALNRSQRTRRPSHADIDCPEQSVQICVVPETPVEHTRHTKTGAQFDLVL